LGVAVPKWLALERTFDARIGRSPSKNENENENEDEDDF
jgi:hypothetical protein